MLSHTRRPRPRTLSNESAAEKDILQSLRRRSIQSINNFSFRRLLGNEALGNSYIATSYTELPSTPDEFTKKDGYGTHQSLLSRDTVVSQPLMRGRRSYQDNKHYQVQDLIFVPTASSSIRPPLAHVQIKSQTKAEKPSGTLSPSSSATDLFRRPLFSKKLHHSHSMGNKISSLSQNTPFRKGRRPRAQSEADEDVNRPVSSPLPAPLENLSHKVIIPDRHSSITLWSNEGVTTDCQANKSRQAEAALSQSSNSTREPSNQAASPNPILVPSASSNINPPTATRSSNSPTSKSQSPHASISTFRPLIPLLTLTLSTPAPPLTPIHFSCYQSHRHVHFSSNIHNPVPCMTCGNESGMSRWKCQWCCLRICGTCMESLGRIPGRDLNVLVRKFEEEGRGFVGGRLEEWGEKVERVWKSGGTG